MEEERRKELEKMIDAVWWGFLGKLIKKKEVKKARSELGDEVDLFLPQIRALYQMHRNSSFPNRIYTYSYLGAKRNAYSLARKAGVLLDPLWEFDQWEDTRALNELRNVTKIFSEMIKINNEGLLSVEDVYTEPPDHIKITFHLEKCAECFGIKADHPVCYHHAGMLTGIVSELLNIEELYGYETECCATGGDKCVFVIEKTSANHKKYLNPGRIDSSLDKRLEDTLRKYLFSWDDVPGDDNAKLIKFLKDEFDSDWAENAKIHKSSDGMAISISNENSAEIMMDKTKNKATLKISDGRTYDLYVKKENGKHYLCKNLRCIGDETDLRYYQLLVINSLIEYPEDFHRSSHNIGRGYGTRLALFLQAYYGTRNLFNEISQYYRHLNHLQITIMNEGNEIRVKEVAEIYGLSKDMSKDKVFLEFLIGELEGLFSVIRKKSARCRRITFQNDEWIIQF